MMLGAPLDSAGDGRGEERGPEALRAAGLASLPGLEDAGDVVGPLRDPRRDPATGIIAARQLARESAVLRDAVASVLLRGRRPFVLGGDCSILPGALAGAHVAIGSLSLWMVDGHPDALDGATSATGEAADMDLAVVLGRGAPALTGLAGSSPIVEPERVTLVGHRLATDQETAAELALVPPTVGQSTAPDVRARGAAAVAREMLVAAGDEPVWLHLDLDVLDAGELPAVSYPQPDGLDWDDLVELVSPLLAAPDLVGVTLADFEADRDPTGRLAHRVVEALRAAWPADSSAPRTG